MKATVQCESEDVRKGFLKTMLEQYEHPTKPVSMLITKVGELKTVDGGYEFELEMQKNV